MGGKQILIVSKKQNPRCLCFIEKSKIKENYMSVTMYKLLHFYIYKMFMIP